MNGSPPPTPSPASAAHWTRWVPALRVVRGYRREWLGHDLLAGLVLTAVLIPVGMGYAQASGLPPIHGLYATVLPLLAYALFGPSRVLVLGPDSTLAAVIAAIILPLAAGSPGRALALAGALALLTAAFQVLLGLARLGMVADLLSKPIRLGFMNAIAFTVIISQLPGLLGARGVSGSIPDRVVALVAIVRDGLVSPTAVAFGLGSLVALLLLRRWRPRWPAVLLVVVAATALSALLLRHGDADLPLLGTVPRGLPLPAWPGIGWHDVVALAPGALIIALLSLADTSVLSRTLAARDGSRVDQNQEMVALGLANAAAGLFQGFPVSSSSSRTPVAEAAGARTQLTGVFGAAGIVAVLVLAPGLLQTMPIALLSAVVIVACLSFADPKGLWALRRQRRVEFLLALVCFAGVVLLGVLEGIGLGIGLSLMVLIWNTWHPYSAVLVRVDGRKGFHDALRHPTGRTVPGLVLFRWDAPLFFANAEVFRERALQALDEAPTPAVWLVVAADAMTDIDTTAAESLGELMAELRQRQVQLHLAGLKGPVRDRLFHYGLTPDLTEARFSPTVGAAVNLYRATHPVNWKDWDED